MDDREAMQTLSAVYDALMCDPPRLEVAEMLYRSIPGFEDFPLPAPSDIERAIHLRAGIVRSLLRSQESDSQSDPGDNFATQQAGLLCRQRDAAQAEIDEHGGVSEFPGLFLRETGERVAAKIITNQWGRSWMLCNPRTGETIGQYFPAGKSTKRTKLWKAGYEERPELAPARSVLTGHGYGNSGSAWVEVQRTDGGWPNAPEWRKKEGR